MKRRFAVRERVVRSPLSRTPMSSNRIQILDVDVRAESGEYEFNQISFRFRNLMLHLNTGFGVARQLCILTRLRRFPSRAVPSRRRMASGGRRRSGAMLRPSLQRGAAPVGQGIDPALDAIEPSIDVMEKDFSGVRIFWPEIPHAARTHGHRSRTAQRLLAIGCHDRRPRAAAGNGIALTALVLCDQPGALLGLRRGLTAAGATSTSTPPRSVTPSIPKPSRRHRLR